MVVLTCSDACKPYFLRQPHTILFTQAPPAVIAAKVLTDNHWFDAILHI